MSEQTTDQSGVETNAGFGCTVEQGVDAWQQAMQYELGITADQAAAAFREIIRYEIDEIFAGDFEAWTQFNASLVAIGEDIARHAKRQQRAAALRRHAEVLALCVLWALLVSVPLTLGLLLIAGQL